MNYNAPLNVLYVISFFVTLMSYLYTLINVYVGTTVPKLYLYKVIGNILLTAQTILLYYFVM